MISSVKGAILKYFTSISAIMAFIVWGSWAYYVNAVLALNDRLITAAAQGSFSLAVTLLILSSVTAIYDRIPKNSLRFVIPAIVIVAVTAVVLSSIHYYIGTAEIAKTVSPGLSITFLYSILTVYKLEASSTDKLG